MRQFYRHYIPVKDLHVLLEPGVTLETDITLYANEKPVLHVLEDGQLGFETEEGVMNSYEVEELSFLRPFLTIFHGKRVKSEILYHYLLDVGFYLVSDYHTNVCKITEEDNREAYYVYKRGEGGSFYRNIDCTGAELSVGLWPTGDAAKDIRSLKEKGTYQWPDWSGVVTETVGVQPYKLSDEEYYMLRYEALNKSGSVEKEGSLAFPSIYNFRSVEHYLKSFAKAGGHLGYGSYSLEVVPYSKDQVTCRGCNHFYDQPEDRGDATCPVCGHEQPSYLNTHYRGSNAHAYIHRPERDAAINEEYFPCSLNYGEWEEFILTYRKCFYREKDLEWMKRLTGGGTVTFNCLEKVYQTFKWSDLGNEGDIASFLFRDKQTHAYDVPVICEAFKLLCRPRYAEPTKVACAVEIWGERFFDEIVAEAPDYFLWGSRSEPFWGLCNGSNTWFYVTYGEEYKPKRYHNYGYREMLDKHMSLIRGKMLESLREKFKDRKPQPPAEPTWNAFM